MKTVTGKIVSSSPVSISTASSILTKFVSTENGASQAVNAYLRRATAAFDELVRIHSKCDRKKHRKDKSDGFTQSLEVSQEPGHAEIGSGKKEKKKRKEGRGDFLVNGDVKSMMVSEVKEENYLLEENKKKRKDKQKDGRNDFGDVDGVNTDVYVKEEKNDVNESNLVEENKSKKHKKKKKRESGDAQENGIENVVGEGGDEKGIKKEEKGEIDIENEVEVGIGEGKKERKKKRKNREVEVLECGDGLEEPWSEKKKRRRSDEEEN